MRYGTVAVAAVLVGVSVWMIVVATGFPRPSTLGAPGSARLPIIYAGLLAFLGVLMIVRSFTGPAEPGLRLGGTARVIVLAGGTAACIYLWPLVHFLVLFVPATFLCVRWLGGSWIAAGTTAIVLPGAVYALFALALAIPFP